MWHVYVRKGVAFIPDVAQTEAGFFLDVEPVRVVELPDIQSLAAAIEQAMAVGNPRVPTPTRAAFPKPVVVRFSGTKNWKAFVECGACFTILRGDSDLEITETGRNDGGERIDTPSMNQKLSSNPQARDIAKRIIERAIQRADLA